MLKKYAELTGHQAAIFALCPAAQAGHLLSAGGDGWIVDWDLARPELGKLVAKVEAQVFSLCRLNDGHRLVAGDMNGGLHWIDLADPAANKDLAHHQRGVYGILEVADSVFSLGGDGKLSRWKPDEAKSLESLYLSNQALRCIDYSAIRHELAIGSSDHAIYLLDAESLAIKEVLPRAHTNSVFALRYSPDGKYLLSGGRDAMLNRWHLGHGLDFSQPAHWYTINDIAFSPQGRYFATASRDKTIKVWDFDTMEILKVLEAARDGGHFNSINRLLWMPDGLLLSASDDRKLVAWEMVEEDTP